MTGSGWASPSGEPVDPGEQAQPPPLPDGPETAPPYYQPLPDGSQGWGTPALPYGAPTPPPYGSPVPPPYGSPTPPPCGSPAPPPYGTTTSAWNELKPGIAPLRPLTTGELLDGAFTTLRRYWRSILVPGAVVSVVETLLVLLIQAATNRQGNLASGSGAAGAVATGLIEIVTALAGILLAAVAAAVVQRGILGQPITFAEAWAVVRPRKWTILGAAIVSTLIWVFATLLIFIPGVYFYVAVHFATVVVVIEGGTVRSSIRRSRNIVKGAWWRTFGLLLLVTIIAGIIGGFLAAPFEIAAIGSAFSNDGASIGLGAQALADVGRLLAGIVTVPFTSAAVALIYIDRRMRDEGLDVALRQAAGA